MTDTFNEKPPLAWQAPPEYSSTVDLSGKGKVAPDSESQQSVKCESKNPRRRRIIKIAIIVGVVAVVAVLLGLMIKFAVQKKSGDDGLQVYNLLVKNTTSNYQVSVGVHEERIVAFKDSRRSTCYLYFPQGDSRGFHKSMFKDKDDSDSSSATLTYKTTEESGYQLALSVIPDAVSTRMITASTGTLISEFCRNHQAFFLEALYGAVEDGESDEQKRNILIVLQ